MADDFRFTLTDEEKNYLKDLVARTIHNKLDPENGPGDAPEPPTTKLQEHYGAFVTLKTGGNLRGCIGNVQGERPLVRTIENMAVSAAFQDPRFPPLRLAEFNSLDIEISILSPVEECPDPEKIEVGRHGLIIMAQGRSGLLLPQVASEWGWDKHQFLDHTCRKAGLPSGCWKAPDTVILWFQAEVF